ncbi:hypothetical protein [Salinicola halophilus]|uniref:hypothetical protein n=1 Tax=Salinicola halophilus TaxID=184065 RepID=UPI000DA1B8C0|nr:hypothetical protein [Salinicola halophilus]
MTIQDSEFALAKIDRLIEDTKVLISDFEATDMDDKMTADYDALQTIYQRAVAPQREQTLALLDRLERAARDSPLGAQDAIDAACFGELSRASEQLSSQTQIPIIDESSVDAGGHVVVAPL